MSQFWSILFHDLLSLPDFGALYGKAYWLHVYQTDRFWLAAKKAGENRGD